MSEPEPFSVGCKPLWGIFYRSHVWDGVVGPDTPLDDLMRIRCTLCGQHALHKHFRDYFATWRRRSSASDKELTDA